MGEIVFALFVGGWMVFLGVFMNSYLTKEERKYNSKETEGGFKQ